MGLRDIIKNLTVQNKNDPTRGHSLNNQLIYYSIIVKLFTLVFLQIKPCYNLT